MLIDFLLYLGLTMFFVHEMDAIRRKEWRMFIFLKHLDDHLAYRIFTIIHIPLYLFIFWALFLANERINSIFGLVLNSFYIFHLILHLLFVNNPKNEFKGFFTWFLLISMALTGATYFLFVLI